MPGHVDQERDEWFRQLGQHTSESDRSAAVAIALSITLGWLGVDRFYLGYPWLGMLKLCTFGGFFLWWLIDVILLCSGSLKDGDGGGLRGRAIK